MKSEFLRTKGACKWISIHSHTHTYIYVNVITLFTNTLAKLHLQSESDIMHDLKSCCTEIIFYY